MAIFSIKWVALESQQHSRLVCILLSKKVACNLDAIVASDRIHFATLVCGQLNGATNF